LFEAVPLALRSYLRLTPEVPLTPMSGRHFGVCGLLAMPNIHQILGGSSTGYPRFVLRESACVSSS